MGKATRWFRSLLGAKKLSDSPAASNGSGKENKWGPFRSLNDVGGSFAESSSSLPHVEGVDANKHAIAVAAATAAVAEAALAAAQAAAEVVRLTSGGSRASTAYLSGDGGGNRQRELAAVKIQSAFRAYLARRALRALKGLVKLQALVRGHIVRKQSTDMLRRMQAMARIQARACANRAYMSESPHSSSKSSQNPHHGFAAPTIFDHHLRAYNAKHDGSVFQRRGSKSDIKDNVGLERTHLGSNWFDHWMEENSRNSLLKNGRADDEKNDKILEIDTWKPRLNPKGGGMAFQTSRQVSAWNHNEHSFTPFETLSRHSTEPQKPNPSQPTRQALSLSSLKHPQEIDEAALWTAENSPQMHSASSRPGSSSRRGPFTPARSECSRSLFGDYLSYPNYMANTESSRAKFRSQSAPRQRMEFEKPGSTKMVARGLWDADSNSEKGLSLHADFRSKGYPNSARLDRSGTTVQGGATAYSSTYGARF